MSAAQAAGLTMPDGWAYATEFLSTAEEAALLQIVRTVPFENAQYKDWRARRRIVSYGGRYDFSRNELDPAAPIPEFLLSLRQRVADWSGLAIDTLNHAMISEYRAGTPLGWHRDVHHFRDVIGISLLGHARMRFRPYPPQRGQRAMFAIDLAPRSIYMMRGPARWAWQHAVSPTAELRYSITFRSQ